MRFFLAATCLLATGLSISASAQEKMLTIDDIYDPVSRIDFGGPPVQVRWMNDGKHYLQTKRDPRSRAAEVVKIDAITGASQPLFDAAKMEAAFLAIGGFSADEAKALAHKASYRLDASQTAVVLNTANDLFYYQLGSDRAVRLTNTPEAEAEEDFSPNSKLVSFVRASNLYVVDVATQRERQLTVDGNAKLLNGQLDWVYQEEVYGRDDYRGYWWSPDSSRIAFLQLDEQPVREFTVIDHIPRLQDVEKTTYPKAGDANPGVKLAIVSAAGGPAKWIDLFKYTSTEPLIVRVGWTPDSKKTVYEIQNREQTWLDLNYADPLTGRSETILRETTKAWVDVNGLPYWLSDGTFLWLSDRNGWQHLYHYRADGKLIRQITNGNWEVRSLHGVDEASGCLFFSGTEHSHIAVHAYRVKIDGAGLTRVTQKEGNHNVSFNSGVTHYIDSWSDVNTPTEVSLFNSEGAPIRVINERTGQNLSDYKLGKPEFLQVKTRDGFLMEALMIKPPGFDPAKKYPVFSFTYGGPHAPQVRNAWGGATYLWHQMLAQQGYIIWICDNRTASGKGAESVWPVYKNFGELELRDLEDALSWLKSQPYIDGSRVGIWGWSFGGFMTSYALTHSQSFKLGIAGGSVTDWRLYDSIYTERYMQTPQNNPEGYRISAPLAAAKQLHGKLLLIHGAMDDNVHMQNTLQFAYELQKAGKQFQLMIYPRSRHGVTDPYLVKHMRSMMTEFIVGNL